MMQFLRYHDIPVPTPLETTDGNLYCKELFFANEKEKKLEESQLVSLVEHLPGVTFREANFPTHLLREIGQLAGKMDTYLKEFQERLENNSPWKLSKLPELTGKIHRYCTSTDIRMGLDIVEAYKRDFIPLSSKLQRGIIHADVNTNNIIVKSSPKTKGSPSKNNFVISGLVDFADAYSSYYIYELATVMADMMTSCRELAPLETGRQIFRGYVEEFPLNKEELSVLRLCICIRLLQYYVLKSHSLVASPGNKYIDVGRKESLESCRYLWQLDETEFIRTIL